MYRDKTVGVVVPAHDEEGFVGAVIDTMPAFVDRIYVVDDCSTDGTWTEIERHAARANRPDARGTSEGTHGDARADGGFGVDGSGAGDGPGVDGRSADERGESVVSSGAVTSAGLPDAASTTGTIAAARVVPIRHERNRGRGGAVKTGYRRALADGMDVVAVMDADSQHPPDYLNRIVDPVATGRADYAKGTRLRHRDRSAMSRWRFFGNSLLTFLTKVSTGYWKMTDPQNGYTAISRDALERLSLNKLYNGYGFLNDVLAALNAREMTIADVSHPAIYGDEQSEIRYGSFVPNLSAILLRNFLGRLSAKYLVRDFHPLVILYLVGAVGLGMGLLGSLVALWSLFGMGSAFVSGALSILLAAVGGVALAMGMAYDRRENAGLEVGGDGEAS
jgi:glycosyltransferase involved in cell wall biosynthesis